MRFVSAGDSAPVANDAVQGLPAAHLHPATARRRLVLGWKQSPRGAVDGARPEDSTPVFAEMAAPGTVFRRATGTKTFLLGPEVRRSVRWPENLNRARFFEAANVYAAGLLTLQRQYASWAGMGLLDQSLEELEQRLAEARERAPACSRSVGAAACPPRAPGSTPPTPTIATSCQFGIYNRALDSNLPFPKTRRIVFLNNRPATLPGWAELAVAD
jgi:CRISPR-associated protein Csm5